MQNSKKMVATQIDLPANIKTMARMAAAQRGVSLSLYIASVLKQDAERLGIAHLVVAQSEEADAAEEVQG